MKFYIQFYLGKLINWFTRHFTPKGRKVAREEKFYLNALKGFNETAEADTKLKSEVKKTAQEKAQKKLKGKKILGFQKQKSLSKNKITKHELHQAVSKENKEDLNGAGLKIDPKTLKFKDA